MEYKNSLFSVYFSLDYDEFDHIEVIFVVENKVIYSDLLSVKAGQSEQIVSIPLTEENNGKKQIWIGCDFTPGASHQFEIIPGKPKSFPKTVSILRESNFLILENKNISQINDEKPSLAHANDPT